jgi:coproporphyrinogen III oxidase-like Fe-S oxidoreductase
LNLESRYGSNFSEKLSKSLIKETETILKFTNISSISSIYFGGGTPSLAPPSTFHALIQFLKRNFDVNDNAEITIECNPSSANMLSKLEEYAKCGINRVSIGLQVLCFNIIYYLTSSSTNQYEPCFSHAEC